MIQRIQSFWLVLAACCMALCFMTPVAKYQAEMPATGQSLTAQLDLIAKGESAMYSQMQDVAPEVNFGQKMSGFTTWPLITLAALCIVLDVICIFMYKNRVRQMRVVAVGFLLNVIYVFLLFFWAVDAYAKAVQQCMAASEMHITWVAGSYAPIAAIVFLILAHRGIKKDEEKVRAADRLR